MQANILITLEDLFVITNPPANWPGKSNSASDKYMWLGNIQNPQAV